MSISPINGTRAQIRTVILISGSGTNLQAIINEVRSGELEINLCAVISDRPGIQGLERAEQAGIPTRVVDYQKFEQRADADTALGRELESTAPDLVILAGFMRILPAEIVTRYRGHMLNIHPS
ncbi:MAG: formyltransferase family protein, partial [Gammaproteobacteria bacterium]|nr:formyltransferase family protein [Gammaproteobacteria bacterium]